MAIESINTNSVNNTGAPNEQAFNAAVDKAKTDGNGPEINDQMIENGMTAFAPMLLMPLASKILSEALSE